MAISVTCPNGHELKVKDGLAGKSGFCPRCHSRVFVPMPLHTTEKARISDDEILGLLGAPAKLEAEPPPSSESELETVAETQIPEWETGLPGYSVLRKQKACPQCGHLTSIAFTHCPRCGALLPNLGTGKK